MRLTLFPKLVIVSLALSLPPLLWLSLDAARRIGEVGHEAVERSTQALDGKARQGLEVQAVELADKVARFLEERIQDLRSLSKLPKRTEVFIAFSQDRTGEVWKRRVEGGEVSEVRERVPLYSELSWIGPDGREQFRLQDGVPVPSEELCDVSRPQGTTYGVEGYFSRALAMPESEPYVGHLVGRHVGKQAQLAGAASPEEAVGGAEYVGHVRFALAVREEGILKGVVALALDHRHLMEFTQHVLPLSRERVVFPSYASGNYAFLFDDEGWIITHPKLWDIRGLDAEGRWVPPYSPDSSPEDIEAGRIPFKLDEAGFVDANYPLVAEAVRKGESGVTRTFNVAGVDKVMAYAPIRFRYGPYRSTGVFGGVTIGARTEAFHREAAATGRAIEAASHQTLRTGVIVAFVLGLVVLGSAFLASREISKPARTMAYMARQIASGDLSVRVNVPQGDELGDLANDLNQMAHLLGEKETSLRKSLADLARSNEEAHAYAERLEEQLRILSHIQSTSEVLGTTFDREEVLRIILQTCVEGLGFDRVLLYILDPDEDRLPCAAVHGFDPADELRARQKPFSLARHECVPVRVVKTGLPVHVRDVDRAEELSALDLQLAREAQTSSFVYVPMKIQDAVVGALGADNGRTGRLIPEHLVGPLQILANQAARSIERARLYEEATRARAFVEAVIDSMGTGLATLDPEGRVLTLNPYAQESLGIDAQGARGRKLGECGVDATVHRWAGTLLAGGAIEPAEFDLETPGGKRTFAWVPSRFAADGGEGLILQFRDVTQDRAMRRGLERVDRLASLGRMAAGVAHEIRNPLTGVSLLLDDLHDRMPPGEDRVLAERSLQEIERLESIVQELLDYARVGRMEPKPCRLGEVVEQSLFLVKKQARNQGVSVVVEVEPSLPQVTADREKLKQALLNLYVNALQVMPEGGELHISAFAHDGEVTLRVQDTGPGLSEGDDERIFEPFYTLRPGGTGLGLSITHTIISDHGGRIEVESKTGRGAAFTIHLPAV